MGRKLSYGMAINEALHQMMGADERVFILGEDVAKMGGDFGITKGIWEKWPNRIKDTALSESAILGLTRTQRPRRINPELRTRIMPYP